MNEVKKIHLGRQPFTIATDAHHQLEAYLEAIKHQVGKQAEVLKEVETRMAELLTERGVTDEKVVLAEDVDFLKKQLGEPGDFKDEQGEGEMPKQAAEPATQKRLFRDTDNAMVAGVASGLATFFGIEPIIVRLVFVVLTFAGASGILIYILLWLLVPEAKSSSEKLQMRGQAVTVDSLKQVVDRVDLPGAAKRVGKTGKSLGRSAGRNAENIAKLALGVVGCLLVAGAMVMFVGTTIVGAYLWIHGAQISDQVVFPVGTKAIVALLLTMATLYIGAFLVMVAGLTMVKRKALIRSWVAATAIGLFFLFGGLGTATGLDVASKVRDTYHSLQRVRIEKAPPFSSLHLTGRLTHYRFEKSDSYAVEIHYLSKQPSAKPLPFQVVNDTLYIDTSTYQRPENCQGFCFTSGFLEVTIRAPRLEKVDVSGDGVYLEQPFIEEMPAPPSGEASRPIGS